MFTQSKPLKLSAPSRDRILDLRILQTCITVDKFPLQCWPYGFLLIEKCNLQVLHTNSMGDLGRRF